MRERFAGLLVLRIVPGRPRHMSAPTEAASASPLRWGRFYFEIRPVSVLIRVQPGFTVVWLPLLEGRPCRPAPSICEMAR